MAKTHVTELLTSISRSRRCLLLPRCSDSRESLRVPWSLWYRRILSTERTETRYTCKDGNVLFLEQRWQPDNDPLHFGRYFSALRHSSTLMFISQTQCRCSDRPEKSEFQHHKFMALVLYRFIAFNAAISLLYFLWNSGEYLLRYCEFIYQLLFLDLFWAPPTLLQNTIIF